LNYARPCRELLLSETTIEYVIDFSDAKAFAGASVFPHVLVFCKRQPTANHRIQIRTFDRDGANETRQSSLTAAAIQLTPMLDVESRVSTQPLDEVATLG